LSVTALNHREFNLHRLKPPQLDSFVGSGQVV